MPHTRLYALVVAVISVACSEPTNPTFTGSPELRTAQAAATSEPSVTSAFPSRAAAAMTLDVEINGTGFTTGAQATLQLGGVVDPRVRVNNTRFVRNTQVIANVTIAPDARLASYDVVVTLVSGKKGIGTERFAVVSISVFDLAGSTGRYGRAYHVNAAGYVLGTLGTDPISPRGFGYWASPTSSFSTIDPSVGSTSLGKGNAAGDWAEHYDFPRVWLVSGENTWAPTTLAPLGSIAVIPNAINASRVVVGHSSAGAVRWESPTSPPVLLPLPAISGIDASSANAWAINASGEIVGSVNAASGTSYALRWTDNGQQVALLPLASGSIGQRATGINDAGVIVGFSIRNGGSYPMRWTPNGSAYTITSLTTSTAKNLAGSINQCGRAVGGISGKAYVWDASGAVTLLPPLPGGSAAEANAINDAGIVVGQTTFVAKGKSSVKPTLWTGIPAC